MADIVNIGLSPTAHETANAMLDDFTALKDVGKFAFAIAIKNDLLMNPDYMDLKESKRSVWNVGSIDPDGKMASLVKSLYENITEPYKYIELLINAGLIYLRESTNLDSSIDIGDYL